jgi:hypothetical protein
MLFDVVLGLKIYPGRIGQKENLSPKRKGAESNTVRYNDICYKILVIY